MKVTKIKIIEQDDSLTDALLVHDNTYEFNLFIDKQQRVRTHVKGYLFISQTPIIEI